MTSTIANVSRFARLEPFPASATRSAVGGVRTVIHVHSGELADLVARAHALEKRVIQLQRTIDFLRSETQACIAARERELDLMSACETD